MSTIDKENLKHAVMLRAARNMLGLSLKQVGEQLSVTSAGAGKWENGLSPIKASVFNQLAKFYRYNGVIMKFDEFGEPTVTLTSEGLRRLQENPKKPTIIPLSSIYVLEQGPSSSLESFELEMKKIELERLREKNPDMSEIELEAALKAVLDLKAEQWEELMPKLIKFVHGEEETE